MDTYKPRHFIKLAVQWLQRTTSGKWRPVIEKAIWVTLPFVGTQIIRLLSNIALAWLLAPELLGAMVLINTLRLGVELLTDIGIRQSVVSHPRGANPDFYNTAWTLQIIRGILLTVLMLALAFPISAAYDDPALRYLLPAVAPLFLILGLASPARFLLQKRMEVRTLSLFDLALSTFAALAQILLAWVMPTIWALILGLLIGATASTLASYFLMDYRTLRLRIEKETAFSIVTFGKWIFASSLIYFLSNSFDRLYFADLLSAAALGVYGIAKTYSETLTALFARISGLLVFPMVSSSQNAVLDLRRKVRPARFAVLSITSLILAIAIALADEFIKLLYDARYENAGKILSILLIGTWFSILNALAESVMLGLRKPAGTAFANGLKLAAIVVSLPFALSYTGFLGALFVFVLADFVRYLVLARGVRRAGLGFSRQDILLTLGFVAQIFLFREMAAALSLTDGVQGWIRQIGHLSV